MHRDKEIEQVIKECLEGEQGALFQNLFSRIIKMQNEMEQQFTKEDKLPECPFCLIPLEISGTTIGNGVYESQAHCPNCKKVFFINHLKKNGLRELLL